MTIELLSCLGERTAYERYAQHITRNAVDRDLFKVVTELGSWYDNLEAEHVEWDKFGERFLLKYPKADTEYYDVIFTRLASGIDFDKAYANELINGFIQKDFGVRMADIALKAAEDGSGLEAIEELYLDYLEENGTLGKLGDFEALDSIDELSMVSSEGGLNWRLIGLNQRTGMAMPGDLVLVAARPNSGKTTFLASEATYFAEQLQGEDVILWFNNEEQNNKIRRRQWVSLLQTPWADIESNPAHYTHLMHTKIGGMHRLRTIQKSGLSVGDINAYMKRYDGRVKCIFIDQLRKVRGFEKSSNELQRLQRMAEWARELARDTCPVIVTHQLGTEAKDIAVPDQSMLYGSKTELAGECDTIVMLGNTQEGGLNPARTVSIAKAKEAVGPLVIEGLSNQPFDVNLRFARGYFEEVL